MLPGIMNEQGNCLGSKVRDDISEKYRFSHVFLLRPKQKNCVVRVTRPYLLFWSRPYFFFRPLKKILKNHRKSGTVRYS